MSFCSHFASICGHFGTHLAPLAPGHQEIFQHCGENFHHCGEMLPVAQTQDTLLVCIRVRECQLTDEPVSLEIRFWSAITHILSLMTPGRHEIITKEILELDPVDNVWTVVERQAAMHDSYDVCLVANLNPRNLFTP